MSLESYIESIIEESLSELDLSGPLQGAIMSVFDEAISILIARHNKPGSTFGTFLADALTEARDEADFSFLEDYVQENLDPSEIATLISERMKTKIIRFDQSDSVAFGENSNCPTCYRPKGKWVSGGGSSINDELVSSPGKSIIIIDDL